MKNNKKIMESINRMLFEGEMETAEAALAAKDLVDRLQDMVEDIGKMSNEELPALVDAIRNSFGPEKASQYSASTNQLLTDLLNSVKSGRDSLDNATMVLTGEAQPGVEQSATDKALEAGSDEEGLDVEDLDKDEEASSEEPLPSKSPLGRDVRPEAKKESRVITNKAVIENKLWKVWMEGADKSKTSIVKKAAKKAEKPIKNSKVKKVAVKDLKGLPTKKK